MAWQWRCEKADGSVVLPEGSAKAFDSQGDAEAWLGDHWQRLRQAGADRVTLLEGEIVSYTMSLHEM
jgi:hypothetical protein